MEAVRELLGIIGDVDRLGRRIERIQLKDAIKGFIAKHGLDVAKPETKEAAPDPAFLRSADYTEIESHDNDLGDLDIAADDAE